MEDAIIAISLIKVSGKLIPATYMEYGVHIASIYMCVCVCVYIRTYIVQERDRDRQRERERKSARSKSNNLFVASLLFVSQVSKTIK